eukprot:scaffold27248_cov133-Isochrysis_galbana.AAC.3
MVWESRMGLGAGRRIGCLARVGSACSSHALVASAPGREWAQLERTSPQSSTTRAPSSHSSKTSLACHWRIPSRSFSICFSAKNRAPRAQRVRVYTALRRFSFESESPHSRGGCRASSPGQGEPHSDGSRSFRVLGVEPKLLVHWHTPSWSAKYVECIHRIAHPSVLVGGRMTDSCQPGMSCSSPLSAGNSAKQPMKTISSPSCRTCSPCPLALAACAYGALYSSASAIVGCHGSQPHRRACPGAIRGGRAAKSGVAILLLWAYEMTRSRPPPLCARATTRILTTEILGPPH